jgi:hypothetical protein
MTKAGKAKCRKHDRELDIAAGEGCPDPDNPCKYRSDCIIHAYSDNSGRPEKPTKPCRRGKQPLLP